MPEGIDRKAVYKALVEHIFSENRELVSLERLELFRSKARRKYPLLEKVGIGEDLSVTLPEDEDLNEEGILRTLGVVIACTFKVLEMFSGSKNARERIQSCIDSYRTDHPEIDDPSLKRFLPRKEEAQSKEEGVEDIKDMVEGEGEGVGGEEGPEGLLVGDKEGVPFYDPEKKEWVLRPAHIVQKVKDEHADIEPAFEEHALKVKKVKRTVKRVADKGKAEEEMGEPFLWLQEEFRRGDCYFVEGTGQEKNMLCAEFLKEGLDAGEAAIAIVGYPPKLLLSQMQKIGVMGKDLEKVHIIDWHTFKERQVLEVETDGNIRIVPKDPKFMGTILSKVLTDVRGEGGCRAFVSVVSYALAFIDFETVYNFVQITRVKMRKAGIPCMFTVEAGQHGKDVSKSLREVSDGLIRIREGMSGANTWKMRADVNDYRSSSSFVKDIVIMRNGVVVLDRGERKEAVGPAATEGEGEAEGARAEVKAVEKEAIGEGIDPYFREKVEMWRGLGFSVAVLEEAMDRGREAFLDALKGYERRANKALEVRGGLDELATRLAKARATEFDDDIKAIRARLRDLEDPEEVQKAISALEVNVSRRLDRETKRRDREKEIFRIRMEHWARQGYNTTRLEAIMGKNLETVNNEFAEFRALVNRLNDIEKGLGKMDTRGHEEAAKAIKERLFDIEGISETEEMYKKLKEDVSVRERLKETALGRRNELMDEVFGWALEGYCVDLIEQIDFFREDLGSIEARLNKLRSRIERLKRMEGVLNGLDLTKERDEEMGIRGILKDVERVDEVEERVLALQDKYGGRLPGEVKAVDENIEKVRELEETWQKLKARLLSESKREDRDE